MYQEIRPIYIFITRSFWIAVAAVPGAVDAVLGLLSEPEHSGPIAEMLGALTGVSVETIETAFRIMTSLAPFLIAQQRAGAARPYTTERTPETVK